jgi:hypothetical protein
MSAVFVKAPTTDVGDISRQALLPVRLVYLSNCGLQLRMFGF